MHRSLVIFGYGYVGKAFKRLALREGWDDIQIVTRTPQAGALSLTDESSVAHCLAEASHLLITAPPQDGHDPILKLYGPLIHAWGQRPDARWLGYLSTTGVYGDHQGAWVDETTPTTSNEPRSQIRLQVEQAWQALDAPWHLFRLSGIYGPGRSVLEDLLGGTARRIDKPGQVFSRIHVEDIAKTLLASAHTPMPGEIYNLADDVPCPSHEVVAHGAQLLQLPCPPLIPYEQASLSPMAQSFYKSCRRVTNKKIKEKLGVKLDYPTYKEGLQQILAQLQRAAP
ncbi:MAG: SDR family oxidoreductase [Holosporales bacterium]